MKSPKEAAKTIFLSKRWARLWLSYPALEFNGRQFPSREAQQSFATTVLNKFLQSDGAPPAEAVRVTMDWLGKPCSAFLDSVFECISKDSPREIDITTSSFDEVTSSEYTIPQEFLLQICDNKFGRLKVLKLDDFNFHQNAYIMADDQNSNNPFAGLGRSLKELHLQSVSFGDDRILNSMISGASLLETLTLVCIIGIHKFQVANHPNLKVLRADGVDSEDFVIKEAHSLEILEVSRRVNGDLQVSSTPNLKLLSLEDVLTLSDERLNKMINELPHMESLFLADLPQIHDLKIVNKDKLRVVEFCSCNSAQPGVIEIDAPGLTNFLYSGNASRFPAFFNKTRSDYGADIQPIKLPSFYLNTNGHIEFDELKQFLAKLSQFCVTVKLGHFPCQAFSGQVMYHELLTPTVECVEMSSHFIRRGANVGILDSLMWSCHPKYLSFTKNIHRALKSQAVLDLEFLCKEFMDRHSNSNEHCVFNCKCWRHQLKDVKMIRRFQTGSIQEDTLLDLSTDALLSLTKEENILFAFTWHSK